MANVTMRQNYTWRDAKGFTFTTRYHVTGDDSDLTFAADLQTVLDALGVSLVALTNCAIQSQVGPQVGAAHGLAYGTNAEYPSVSQVAVMTFTTDSPTIARYKIPAPKIALFDTDGVTILNDGTQAAVDAYVAAVKTAVNTVFISTASGLPYTHFVGGQWRGETLRKRHNQFIKSSHLVAGEGE